MADNAVAECVTTKDDSKNIQSILPISTTKPERSRFVSRFIKLQAEAANASIKKLSNIDSFRADCIALISVANTSETSKTITR